MSATSFVVRGRRVILVEDGYAAERSAGPLSEVAVKLWIEGLDERTHERDFQRGSSD